VLASCRERSNPPPDHGVDLLQEARRLEQATTPPGARVAERRDPVRDRLGIHHAWTVTTTVRWNAYGDHLKRGMPASYDCVSLPDTIRCTRHLTGDRLQLDVSHSEGPSGLSILARFEARPY
jgi:hypothetical protein